MGKTFREKINQRKTKKFNEFQSPEREIIFKKGKINLKTPKTTPLEKRARLNSLQSKIHPHPAFLDFLL